MKKSIVIIPLLVFVLLGFTLSQASAGESPFSVSFAGQYIPFLGGDAGSGSGAPEYEDVFHDGLGLSIEAAYRIAPQIALLGGISYDYYSDSSYKDISFDDRNIITFYVGGKYYLIAQTKGWNPYVRADIGISYFDSVDISYMGNDSDYWDSSWELMCDAGAGVEYRFDNLGVFFEVKARYMGEPSTASALKEYADADESWTLPVVLGVEYHF
ncbi:MAG: outer membrane beta-barrel protein [Deltaproteobacteria bacterium]|nr:outer membrane beta-barrel protein [Candidatus Tharpella sp.]